MLYLILASDPNLPPVHSLPTYYEPPVQFLPSSSSMSPPYLLSTLMRPVIPADDLAPYRLHSRVAHSCPPMSLLSTACFQELHGLLDRIRYQGRFDGYMIISPLLSSIFSRPIRHSCLIISLLFHTGAVLSTLIDNISRNLEPEDTRGKKLNSCNETLSSISPQNIT